MRTCAATRPRLPPEPWLRRTAAPLRDGTYHAESRRPPGAGTRTSSWAMPSAAARSVGDQVPRGEREEGGVREDDGSGGPGGAVRCAPGEPAPPRRSAWRGGRRDGGRD